MALAVGCLLGARVSAWHAEVFSYLPPDIHVTIIGTTAPRYSLDEIRLPLRLLRSEADEPGVIARVHRSLRWRFDAQLRRDGFPLLEAAATLGDFDVLHSWELFTEWTRVALLEKARRRVGLAITVWDNQPRHFADHPRRGPVRRAALAAADAFYVVADRSQAALELDGVEADRIVAGRPSVDGERFRPGAETASRAEFGATSDECVVLAVARLEREKGIHHLLDAVALARRRRARVRAVIVGVGRERGTLQAQADALGLGPFVHFAGELPYRELHRVYGVADVFALPSVPTADWQEQWGQSLLEAMASGVACIASRSGAIPEVLGDAGVLVAAADPLELAAAIHRLAGEPGIRVELGKRARARIEAGFTHQRQAAALTALYHRLAPVHTDAGR